ncbi:hypothetical protein HWB57_gp105 [Erwinia phage vB_EamM-Bue1]|uniref:Uncharacterized protein n=1 Tax=Erwinia phage vB_EamM-Bue1 TaxID=2099338 RepID=A0A2U9PFG1_9CAUD|nr:hypothetical protein HWB57_gp105 [Erwinia phage vB_EamM-Bue1]AWT50346.1 hypothetical protein [Erwinia phage vB_EamM-Bue1]
MPLPTDDYRHDPRLAERFEQLWKRHEVCEKNLSQKSQDWAKVTAEINAIKHRAQEMGWVWTQESTLIDAVNFLIRYHVR